MTALDPLHGDPRARLEAVAAHLGHMLPGQAPLADFVHHNTLHGLEHLPFSEALAAARRLTGARGYLPQAQYRAFYREGRITRADLEAVVEAAADLNAGEVVLEVASGPVRRGEVYLTALVYPLSSITGCQLGWQIEALDALRALQADVPPARRSRLLATAAAAGLRDEPAAVEDLWMACLASLGLDYFVFHPEELVDLDPDWAEAMLTRYVADTDWAMAGEPVVHQRMRREADDLLEGLMDRVGTALTLRGVLRATTGEDILDSIRPLVVRHLGAFLDQGLAAWRPPERAHGFYVAWRASAQRDLAGAFDAMPEWHDELLTLPDEPMEVILGELRRQGVPEPQWEAYLERLALELPGWSGMVYWRQSHPGYADLAEVPVDILDYLAVRLVLDRLFAQRLCRNHWRVEANLRVLHAHFRRYRSEFLVRYTLFNTHLPEYLAGQAQRLLRQREQADYPSWRRLADMIWTWRQSPASPYAPGRSASRDAWRLFRLCQHLGLAGPDLRRADPAQVTDLLDCLDRLDEDRSGHLWLLAYERHYREQLFAALAANHGRHRRGTGAASAQLVFCMDDREEGIRRHLEEIDPTLETYGAAGFFGVAMNWRGLDDSKVSPLCPIVITPAHEVREVPLPGAQSLRHDHDRRRRWRVRARDLLHHEVRRNLLSSSLVIVAAAPVALAVLVAKLLAPRQQGAWAARLRARFDRAVPTRVAIEAADPAAEASPARPRLGFTDAEQADRVADLLRTIGLTGDFAPLVVIMGHGSSSENNPHLAAYDCGACSGRHGGPNARVLAAMANRPAIRALLHARGITVPEGIWFLGAERNTCEDTVTWYDADLLPAGLGPAFARLRTVLEEASRAHAQERCRRFASAPAAASPADAWRHVLGRARDVSQVRPELGHATNAAALIGRRAMSRGAFFDRRVFLISYDPTQDPDGRIVEAILLAAGPVGAGISLEYYFSTVDNDGYGCGSKVTHNVAGLFGVMQGTSSDLATGLPQQMIEIHEAMRLLVIVEARTAILDAIYARQPVIRQLVGNGWVLLAAQDPEDGAIHLFTPEQGWSAWQPTARPPQVPRSAHWYTGQRGPLPPALIGEARHA